MQLAIAGPFVGSSTGALFRVPTPARGPRSRREATLSKTSRVRGLSYSPVIDYSMLESGAKRRPRLNLQPLRFSLHLYDLSFSIFHRVLDGGEYFVK